MKRKKELVFVMLLTAILFFTFCASQPLSVVKTEKGKISYSDTIVPLLNEKCFRCHSKKGRSAGAFSIKTHESLMKGGRGGSPIVPFEPENSRIINAVEKNGELKMPPKIFGTMEPEKIEILKLWIREGALKN